MSGPTKQGILAGPNPQDLAALTVLFVIDLLDEALSRR